MEFTTAQEAKNAMQALQGVHLFGRRLVIQPEQEDGGLEEIKTKTAARFAAILESEGGGPAKRGPPPPDADDEPEAKRPQKKKGRKQK